MQAFFMEKTNKKLRGNYKSDEEKRVQRLSIKVTEKEKKEIESKAQKAGLSISDFARQNLVNGYVFILDKKTEEQEQFSGNNFDRRTIIGIGNNLNQLTKYIHQTHEIHEDLHECIKAIKAIMSKTVKNDY